MATLEYDFKIVGMSDVQRAFKSLEQRAREHNKNIERVFGRTAGQRGGPVTQGAGRPGRNPQQDASLRAQRQLNAAQERARARQERDLSRQAQQEKRLSDQRLREQQRAADRMQRARAAQEREENRARERKVREERRVSDRIARDERRAAERAPKFDAHVRAQKDAWTEKDRARRKSERAAERRESQQIAQRRSRRQMIYGAVSESVSSLGQRAITLASAGAGGILAMGLNAGRDAYRQSTALAAQSKQAGNTASMRDIHKDILATSQKTSQEYGVKRADVIASMSSFHGIAGNLGAAKELAPFMTSFAEATSSDPGDVARLTGMAFMRAQKQGMSDKDAAKAAKDIVGTFAAHAASGTIEMSDYAAAGPEILGAASQMMGKKGFVETAAIASAVAQGSIGGGATSAAEAATATSRLVDDLMQNSDKIKKLTGTKEFGGRAFETMGIDPATGVKKLKSFEDTIPTLLAAAQGDVSRLMKMGIDVRGNRAMKGFLDTYVQGTKRAGPGTAEEKGAAAVREAIQAATTQRVSEADAKEMAKAREELDPFAKLEKAIISLADTAIPPLADAMNSLAEYFKTPGAKDTVDTLGKGMKLAAENPKTALGLFAGTSILGNLATTAIGAKITAMVAGGGAAAAGAAGAAGAGAAAAGVAGAGAAGAGAAAAGGAAVAGGAGAAAAGGGTFLGMALGGGAAAVGAAALAAVGGVAAAVYQAKGLYDDLQEAPIMLNEFQNPLEGVNIPPASPKPNVAGDAAKPKESPAEVMKPAAQQLTEAATAIKTAATQLGAAGPNRTDAPSSGSPTSGGR